MLEVERWAELRREHFVRGVSIKELVRRTGLARNTIRAALRAQQAPGFRCPERPSKLDPFKDEIHRLLREDPRLPGVRVRELIEPLGFDGGKTIVDDYLREVRRRQARRQARGGLKPSRRSSVRRESRTLHHARHVQDNARSDPASPDHSVSAACGSACTVAVCGEVAGCDGGAEPVVVDLPHFRGQVEARRLARSCAPFPSSIARSCSVRGSRVSSAGGAGCTSPQSTGRWPIAPRAAWATSAG